MCLESWSLLPLVREYIRFLNISQHFSISNLWESWRGAKLCPIPHRARRHDACQPNLFSLFRYFVPATCQKNPFLLSPAFYLVVRFAISTALNPLLVHSCLVYPRIITSPSPVFFCTSIGQLFVNLEFPLCGGGKVEDYYSSQLN